MAIGAQILVRVRESARERDAWEGERERGRECEVKGEKFSEITLIRGERMIE